MVCPDCGMTTWVKDFGCTLPDCENYGVLTTLGGDGVYIYATSTQD